MPKQDKKNNIPTNSDFRIPNSHFKNPVLFVGAGPGDPELITVKGQKALMAADLVVEHGEPIPQAWLEQADGLGLRRARCTPEHHVREHGACARGDPLAR